MQPDDTARVDTASYFMHRAPYPSWAEARLRFERVRERGRYVRADAYGPWEAYHSDHSVPPEVSFSRYCFVLELVRRCALRRY